MNLKEFSKTKPVLTNIVLVILFLILFSYFSLLILKMYSHHGQAIAVPSYKGMSYKDAVSLTKKKRLRCQVIDSVYVYDARPGTVLEQYPSSGDKVKQRRVVYLTIASVTPEIAPVPKVFDVSLREAQSRLESAGFRIGQISRKPSEFVDLVLEQRFKNSPLSVGTKLPKGTPIDLVVGMGLSSDRTTIPALVGLNADSARALLSGMNLNVGVLVYDNTVVTSYDSMTAKVYKQSPSYSADATVEQGVSFDLWLSIDEGKISPIQAGDSLDVEKDDYFDEQ